MSSRLGHAADLKNSRKKTHWQLDLALPSPQMPDEKLEDFFIPFDPEICQEAGIGKGTPFFFFFFLSPSISVSHSLSVHLFTSSVVSPAQPSGRPTVASGQRTPGPF